MKHYSVQVYQCIYEKCNLSYIDYNYPMRDIRFVIYPSIYRKISDEVY